MRFPMGLPVHWHVPRFVLILQGEVAYWFKISDEQIVAVHTEHILGDCVEREFHCPWIEHSESAEPMLVELVLDTTLDEVDRVAVEQGRNVVINRYRKFMTLARLRKDYSQSSVYPLPEGDRDNVAAIMHPAIPEQWASWLLMLQTANLVFHRVATGSELAAHWSRHVEEHKLLIMGVANYERHMLVVQGAVLFLRTVLVETGSDHPEKDNPESAQSVVDQSIEYLGSVVETQVDAIAIVRLRCAANVETTFANARSENNNSNHPVTEQVKILLSMLLELDIECCTTLRGESAGRTNVKPVGGRPSRYRAFVKNTVLIMDRLLGGLPVRKKLVVDRWSIRRSAARWFSALEPSVCYVKASRRIACVFGVSVVFVVMAVGIAAGALINGIASKRFVYQNEMQQASIQGAEQELYTRAAVLSLQPVMAADSLYIADKLLSSELIATDVLLEELATVITAVSGVELDRLIWARVGREEIYDSLTHSLDSVSSQMNASYSASNVALQLELSGRVSGETLKEQQVLLNGFVSELRQVPGALDAKILQSPIDNALSSESDMNSLGRYRVSLILGNQQ